jgi:hypothetical protein
VELVREQPVESVVESVELPVELPGVQALPADYRRLCWIVSNGDPPLTGTAVAFRNNNPQRLPPTVAVAKALRL